MKDGFGRDITYLRLSVTELCNLRCRYCMPMDGIVKKSHADMLTEEEMVDAVRAAASLGITKVRITGGEPLVKRNILSIVSHVAAVEGIRETCLTTNGTLLKPLAKPLRDAGLDRINISVDSLDAGKYREITRGGTLRDALDGVEAALDAGFSRVKLNVVLIGGFNDTEIPAFLDLTRRQPIDVRFIELMPMVRDSSFGADAMLPCDAVLSYAKDAEPLPPDGGVARLYRLPNAVGSIGLISPVSKHFCAGCNRLRLTADGRLKPCLHALAEYPIKGLPYDAVVECMKQAISAKPERHGELSEAHQSRAGRSMNRIGG